MSATADAARPALAFATTTAGVVRGCVRHLDGRPVRTFLGVPYAESPAGGRRFLPPLPVQPWEGTRDCTAPGAMAPQNADAFTPPSDRFPELWDEESCLNVNVWTPGADGGGRPVLVWIHGGAYLTGSNNGALHDGGALASAMDVVVVALNYRLGALGFLHLPELLGPAYADSSNVALLDQLEALRWVARNIASFGGDPGNVTLFGESAGAAAVGTLLGMPASEGLFRRAILQSGTAERFRSAEESALVTQEFLGLCGLDAARAKELLDLPVGQLLAAQNALESAAAAVTFGVPLPFQPTAGTPAIPRPPLDAIRLGCNSRIDLLVGTNLNEGSFAVEFRPAAPSDPPQLADRVDLMLARASSNPSGARASYEEALARTLGLPPNGKQLLEAYLADVHYRQPTNRLLAARSGSQGKNFSYLFTWESPAMGGKLGSCHALDIPFVFRQLEAAEAKFLTRGIAPQALGDSMSSAWANFARSGAPQAAGLPPWPEYGRQHRQTMILDVISRVESDPRGALREFWAADQAVRPTIGSGGPG
ncbi:carboxylesterase/lipase family protein [Pseudarthrobacter sp. MM222]|uniref:carboxylesterase/lipase family protein n=1 Tax=Pseudarthrobacter sp. MM222 TaxID=3018929 RepID=UPI002220E659|nr:carboxylesterase family protein [Pseudarthrobacter sp. MM222]CAI3797325.1 Carboxylesterase [Pseudarthrobacter sp. MM222]